MYLLPISKIISLTQGKTKEELEEKSENKEEEDMETEEQEEEGAPDNATGLQPQVGLPVFLLSIVLP